MDKLISLAKRRGFIYQNSEIYGGIAGFFDYGHLGTILKENIKRLWKQMFIFDREDVYALDAAIIMNPKVWEASGHVAGFADPVVECKKCKLRDRPDLIYARALPNQAHILPIDLEEQKALLDTLSLDCPKGGVHEWLLPQQFNMMLKTSVGAGEDSTETYLRPETAQGIFVNFKNVIDSFHPKLPFGIAQIGKAFRNEISPRDFLYRVREFEQMEVEYFVKENTWESAFELWRVKMNEFAKALGINDYVEHEIPSEELAHYSKRTIDFEFTYPFGQKELWGLAYRTDYDLRQHSAASGVPLTYHEELGEDSGNKNIFVPHVIEPSLGVDRTMLAVLLSAYKEDELGGEPRIYLKLPKDIAPVRAAVFPLLKNKPELIEKAREVYKILKRTYPSVMFDDNGNIGKRYRRQDEIGTPFCITIDFTTLEDETVTVRDRDTGEQKRVTISDLTEAVK